jgi:molybdopterin molybdotransferase
MSTLITPAEALALTLAGVQPLGTEKLALEHALGRVLAADVLAPIDHPIFDQTAVDGYAFRFADWEMGRPLLVSDHIRAGDAGERVLGLGECSRIFTGAPLPPGADTTVMQELTELDGNLLQIRDAGLRLGGNVRRAGEQIRAGALALPRGQRLNAGGIGFLASLGITAVEVFQRPRVHIIVTGDEFAKTEAEFQRGKIYESNGQMLKAAFQSRGIVAEFTLCKDDPETMREMVKQKSADCDLLILTGGVSVGDFDFSRGALEANSFEVIFHQVAQKPGKPLLFCARQNQRAFGLPGNPRAVLMCYHIYVWPLLDLLEGQTRTGLPSLELTLAAPYRRKPDGKIHFVTGKLTAQGLQIEGGQQSHMLQSFAEADLIVKLPAEPESFVAGDVVKCHWLPQV